MFKEKVGSHVNTWKNALLFCLRTFYVVLAVGEIRHRGDAEAATEGIRKNTQR